MARPRRQVRDEHVDRVGPGLGLAVGLGALHGPAELLPVSSSAHLTLVPWLLGRPAPGKRFEVAVHAGTALGLLWLCRGELREAARPALWPAAVPPAVAGALLADPIAARLGTPATIAPGLVAGSLAMLAADRVPGSRTYPLAADAWWLGLAQAAALVPGISRNGATLTAARARGFSRPAASRLSRHLALPVVAAAAARTLSRPRPAELAGGAAALASTLACGPLLRWVDAGRPLAPFAAYRLALAGLVVRRLRKNRHG